MAGWLAYYCFSLVLFVGGVIVIIAVVVATVAVIVAILFENFLADCCWPQCQVSERARRLFLCGVFDLYGS